MKTLRTAMRSIKIVDEEIEQSVIEDVEAAISHASFVYFIGFGFDRRNLSKLGTPGNLKSATVRGTAFGLSQLEQFPIKQHFSGTDIDLHPEADAYRFLREQAEALFH